MPSSTLATESRILFCVICHTDLHQVGNEWSSVMPTTYPIVPGHEMVGRITRGGTTVTKFKPGDLAGWIPAVPLVDAMVRDLR